ncbi:MAG: DUF2971 domain-containing protein [Bacteroidales bacterium]|nr:DUF2971 domain-containing protein [Bacteroidales bacterium]MBN2750587.1 DUF2971 domain-containing protein [Bacteroidales bacterium]
MKDNCNTYLGKAYRFLSFDGLFNTIGNKSLRFTRVDKVNDPLDCSPLIAPLNWDEYSIHGGELFPKFVCDYVSKRVFKSLFICCFCKEYQSDDSFLMWSHYGQSHSQVCFEIDFLQNRYLGGPSEVEYPDSLIDKRNDSFNFDKGQLGLYLITNKLKQWSYEKEVRLIVDTKNPNIDNERFKFNSNSEYLYVDFDLNYISKVIFGAKSTLTNELKTRSLFTDNGYNPIYEKMYIDPKTLMIKSKPYDL